MRTFFFKLAKNLSWLLKIAAGVFTALISVDPLKVTNPVYLLFVNYAHSHKLFPFYFIIASATLAALVQYVGEPWVKKGVVEMLDTIRERMFKDYPDDALHHHRVTLFKHVGFCWVWGRMPGFGWLKPICRSGHTSQKLTTCFKAPDNADRAEGVVGQAWARNRIAIATHLPEVTESSPESVFQARAAKGSVSIKWLTKKLPKSRSIYAIPIRLEGKPWGAIVLDSRHPDPLNYTNETEEEFRSYAKIINIFLKRARL